MTTIDQSDIQNRKSNPISKTSVEIVCIIVLILVQREHLIVGSQITKSVVFLSSAQKPVCVHEVVVSAINSFRFDKVLSPWSFAGSLGGDRFRGTLGFGDTTAYYSMCGEWFFLFPISSTLWWFRLQLR